MEICKASVIYRKRLGQIQSDNILDISDRVHFLTRTEAEDWISDIKTISQDILFDFKIIENKEIA